YRAVADDPQTGKAVVQAVLRQTGGHPYLTLRLCEEFCKQRGASPNEVDRLVEKSFSNLEAVRSDVHFEQIQRFLGERVEDRLATLALYRRILRGKLVRDQTAPAHIGLK